MRWCKIETTHTYIDVYIYIYISASWIPKNSKLHGETDDMVFWGTVCSDMFRPIFTPWIFRRMIAQSLFSTAVQDGSGLITKVLNLQGPWVIMGTWLRYVEIHCHLHWLLPFPEPQAAPPQGGIATVLSWFHGLVVAFKGAIPWLSLGCWHLLVHSCHSLLLLLKSRLNPRHVWPVSASERKSWFQLVPNTCPYPFKRNQSPDMTSLQQDLCCKIPWRFQSALSQLNIDLWHSKVCQTGMMEVSRVMSSSFS